MTRRIVPAVATAWILFGIAPLFAHHAFESEFDVSKAIRLEGKVSQMEWTNPHAYLVINVADTRGGSASWRIELTSPNHMLESGANRLSFPVGSEITVEGFRAKSGERIVGSNVVTLKATGQTFETSQVMYRLSLAQYYDRGKSIQLTGKFVSVDWVNPFPGVHFAVGSQDWVAEIPPLPEFAKSGWNKATLAPGDVIQIDGAPARDGTRQIYAQSVTLIGKDGKTLDSPRPLLK